MLMLVHFASTMCTQRQLSVNGMYMYNGLPTLAQRT